MKIHRRRESGQATIELAVMLTAVTAMLLGIVMLAGVMVADNRQLLEAKLSAELRAGDADTPAWRSENELGFWSYGSYSVNGRHYATIPFSSGDRLGQVNATVLDAVPGQFSTPAYSRQENYSYRWKSPASFHPSLNSDFSTDPGNALESADLVAGSGTELDPVSGFDRGRRDNASNALRAAFSVWFGSRISHDFLSGKPSNQVYMPRTTIRSNSL